ncbi:cytochrome d ubiquinol oxidase subunit II [Polymorphospora rubra]|uniref:Cytochrome bd oxidase subunit II n=1 Tax=Polymorphospora rubra TaxID=338584 RepID=A0A810N126_9ACTN|nr:cytochrome d ubiquinol oxidase subunit II [Polymorphospora rubra]BCJ66354.1 cytochrome bd oxidase subunit II [Polymorphospora rubra]
METLWYALLGLFFATYLVLGGYDYGTGLLLARTRSGDDRRAMLNAVGPFFLGNEVWLVAAIGILLGAFPFLEGELLSGLYPAVALALAGVVVVTVAVQLRSRLASPRIRTAWDRAVIAGSVIAALGWGAVLAGLLQGVPLQLERHAIGVGHVFTPFVAAGALALLALVAVHGAAFLALRLPAGQADHFARLGRRLAPAVIGVVGLAAAVGALSGRVRETVQQPGVAVLMLVVLVTVLAVAGTAITRRPGLAFAATSVAVALPVLLVGAATWPYALVSSADPAAGITVADAAASGPTLRLLTWAALPLLPALLGFQLMSWWVFRGRTDGRAPVYW